MEMWRFVVFTLMRSTCHLPVNIGVNGSIIPLLFFRTSVILTRFSVHLSTKQCISEILLERQIVGLGWRCARHLPSRIQRKRWAMLSEFPVSKARVSINWVFLFSNHARFSVEVLPYGPWVWHVAAHEQHSFVSYLMCQTNWNQNILWWKESFMRMESWNSDF